MPISIPSWPMPPTPINEAGEDKEYLFRLKKLLVYNESVKD